MRPYVGMMSQFVYGKAGGSCLYRKTIVRAVWQFYI